MTTDPLLPDPLVQDQGAALLRWNLEGAHPERAPIGDIQQRIRSSDQLPPLPEVTRRLLALRDSPEAGGVELADIVERDPLLAAQLLRRANSAQYAAGAPIASVREAIVRVLGYEHALAEALALTALSPLATPNRGPIGRERVWHHGLVCAQLMQRLALHIPAAERPRPGLIQLAGLTHNIGYLLLGHLLPDAFTLLARLIAANPELNLPTIERFALGVDHGLLGFWLFEVWAMPEPLRAVALHHHNPDYDGAHQGLVGLCALADRLLDASPLALGARASGADPQHLGARLGIGPEALADVLATPSQEGLAHVTMS